jgi:ribonuclease P protein component
MALARGKRFHSAHFTALVSYEAEGYAVVVPKKTARLSVTRHRIKRRVTNLLRTIPDLPKALILFPKASVSRLDAPHLAADLVQLVSTISLNTPKRIQ